MTVTETQLIDWLERSISVVSIIGCLFIILTFSFFPEFRKPMNRLIFYASFGNICSNIATSIATSGLPERGASMGLCRLQGFFIQMFMTADVVWAMFMALNVFLAFRGYTSQELLNLEVCYNVVAYGVPSIPAIIYLILDLTMDTGIYGPATLWCWVSDDYEWLRVGFFYGPALCLIALIIVTYFGIGFGIVSNDKELKSCSRGNPDPSLLIKNPFTAGDASKAVTRVTEIQVTTELRENTPVPDVTKPACATDSSRSSFGSMHKLGASQTYSELLTSSSGPGSSRHPYTAVISAVRLGSMQDESHADIELEDRKGSTDGRPNQGIKKPKRAADEYLKIALTMFLGLIVIWTPSCANRMFSLVNPDKPPNYALTIFAAGVLPLQGGWNCIVYIAMSQALCRKTYADLKRRFLLSRMCDLHRRAVAEGYHVDCPPFLSCESDKVRLRRRVWRTGRWEFEQMTRAEAHSWMAEGNRKGVVHPGQPLPRLRTPTDPQPARHDLSFREALDLDYDDRQLRDEEMALPLPPPAASFMVPRSTL